MPWLKWLPKAGLGNDISELPAAGVCLDWMHEKALTIGHYFVSSGAYVVFGTDSPVAGAPDVHKFLTEDMADIFGGKWAFEADHSKIAKMVMAQIELRRDALGINEEKESESCMIWKIEGNWKFNQLKLKLDVTFNSNVW